MVHEKTTCVSPCCRTEDWRIDIPTGNCHCNKCNKEFDMELINRIDKDTLIK